MKRLLFLLALASLALPPTSWALSYDDWKHWNVCGGTVFGFCADVYARTTGNFFLEVALRNTSGFGGTAAAGVITQIGFLGLPEHAGYQLFDHYSTNGPVNKPEYYSLAIWNDFGANKPEPDQTMLMLTTSSSRTLFAGIASNCGTASFHPDDFFFVSPTCGPEDYYYLDYTGLPVSRERDGFTYMSVMNDYSRYGPDIGDDWLENADLYLSATDAADRVTTSYLRTDIPATITPEPASMLLLGSGLAGLAALRRHRRRKDK